MRTRSLVIVPCVVSIVLCMSTTARSASFTLTWEQGAADTEVVKWRVDKGVDPAGPFTLLKTVSIRSASVVVPIGSRLCYRIRAVDSLGQVSLRSNYWCMTMTEEVGE